MTPAKRSPPGAQLRAPKPRPRPQRTPAGKHGGWGVASASGRWFERSRRLWRLKRRTGGMCSGCVVAGCVLAGIMNWVQGPALAFGSISPLSTQDVIGTSFDQLLTLTIRKSVKSWIHVKIDIKIRFYIEFRIQVHWLVLEQQFDRFYGHTQTI